MPASMAILLARIRLPTVAAFLALSITGRFFTVLPGGWLAWLAGLGVVAVLLRAGTLRREPVVVRPPVLGPWRAFNSPASRVPSHGIQSYGQTYAIDLVYDPADHVQHRRPGFRWWPFARRPEDFPGFGQPVFAPADGVVVRVHDRERDHWSRTSPLGMLYLLSVELLRELFGPSRVLGNHVIIDQGNGVYTAHGHLRRRSILVAEGQRIQAGDQVAECGNSGNTTEPHLHFQLMDHPSIAVAAGLPFRFATSEGGRLDTPPNGMRLALPYDKDGRSRPLPQRRVQIQQSWRHPGCSVRLTR